MSSDEGQPKKDLLFVHSKTESGDGLRVVRARSDALEFGEVRAVREGEPIQGDLVRLKQRPEHERLFEVETLLAQQGPGAHAGPAKVSSEAFRDNWEAVFGQARKAQLPN